MRGGDAAVAEVDRLIDSPIIEDDKDDIGFLLEDWLRTAVAAAGASDLRREHQEQAKKTNIFHAFNAILIMQV